MGFKRETATIGIIIQPITIPNVTRNAEDGNICVFRFPIMTPVPHWNRITQLNVKQFVIPNTDPPLPMGAISFTAAVNCVKPIPLANPKIPATIVVVTNPTLKAKQHISSIQQKAIQ